MDDELKEQEDFDYGHDPRVEVLNNKLERYEY